MMTIQNQEETISDLEQQLIDLKEKYKKDLVELDYFKNNKGGFA
jgi:hypothetical protein